MAGNQIYPYNPTIMHRVLSLLFLSLMLSAALHGSVTTLCVPGSLATYQGMSTPCGIGQLSFDSFAFPNPPAGGDDATQIWLTPVPGGFTVQQTLDGGATFSQFTSTSPITYEIDYRFIIDPATAAGADLSMDPPFGDVSIDEFYCNDSVFNSDGFCQTQTGGFRPDHLNVHTNPGSTDPCIDPLNGGNTCFSSIIFQNPGFSFGNVEILIHLNGSSTNPAGFDSLTQSTDLTGLPEPAPVALILGGLLLIPGCRRFAVQRRAAKV